MSSQCSGPMCSSVIGTTSFSIESQCEFAKLSGDWNPLHTDPRCAQRTLAGRLVVHGVHAAVWSLDSLAAASSDLPFPSTLSVRFLKPIYPGETVSIVRVGSSADDCHLQAQVDGIPTVDLRVELRNLSSAAQRTVPHDCANVICRELSIDEIAGRSGSVRMFSSIDKVAERFRHVVKWLGMDRVAGLLCLSQLVGMECPGLHSLLSGFTIKLITTDTLNCLLYRVSSVDQRFRLVKMEVHGLGLRGQVEAFMRHPPIAQPSIQELSTQVEPGEFTGVRALIVGGSRGLGELTAKVLAAGGGHPIVTYARGKDDAERVAEEIKLSGAPCDVLRYDVKVPPGSQLTSLNGPVDYLYYYATGPIFVKRARRFDYARLDEFLGFYVRGFYDLCVTLKKSRERKLSVLYPSSVAVGDQRPKEMTEYAMAKAAGEILCAELNRCWTGLQITCVRLPRLLTDQTASFVSVRHVNSIDVILPVIRQVQATGI
jgi:NAD(P)-dependent dehydrogenase (short-subunit alcohol dehydrogenase family)